MLLTELERFVEEDIGYDDVSCNIIPDCRVNAEVIAKEFGIVAGLAEATQIFEYFEVFPATDFQDGDMVKENDIILSLDGGSRSILRAERLALNFLGRMSGIATITREYVERAGGPRIAGTRKTTPGFRKFEKKAIAAGGGDPHRYNLSDAVMIKDNHIAVIGLEKAIIAAKRAASFTQKIEVEVETVDDAVLAAKMGVDIIMFDNMTVKEIQRAVKTLEEKGLRNNITLEASGGISIENVDKYASTTVDVISIGALTHSSNWLDISLRINPDIQEGTL
ncbi:MAG: nicotinate-nucleotide pyrophosphorylase (carboxylating) [Candidatus Methanoperedens nitroreducens]|uniref:Nicotinate-nucleotide pyrophosphorylase [carboxylating] n=1 Tax=Candidatus Methanoperedens nitratireducens TaxID=1392998 RepID=A0A0P8AHV1_9EURY|nr:carboxylating nicotinate-nucleotide diphosphorylase [Candidatus Methanoperedens sp. BLZ2]KAB2943823.1 MAG: carboxylating nicotinate-nucleotide diphosphorylase [Candidatus Methanoperedens sp.]KPQ44021.1 MAG: nicotinate-nucleotide pyrophosphorylase (carboxylating) [Candidatus Methanoperedens sp. BLZ1]MBZ0177408.1 carboxylating nicotinate-nucleotide diphosphorylase [Candidatus Methanoperedens nitroreducens]MCX9077838.1 carboxylating nicotinate-nucleotide diphosphorylase [Candidatus Methanopered